MQKNKYGAPLIAVSMALVGLLAGMATMASAQTSAATSSNTSATVSTVVSSGSASATVDKPESANDPADTGTEVEKHAPMGGDGIVSSVSGTTIVMGEESDEGGVSYTIDASKATFSNNGATATIADIKVGNKIFVQGMVSGTSVSATSVSLGHPGGHDDHGADGENPNQ